MLYVTFFRRTNTEFSGKKVFERWTKLTTQTFNRHRTHYTHITFEDRILSDLTSLDFSFWSPREFYIKYNIESVVYNITKNIKQFLLLWLVSWICCLGMYTPEKYMFVASTHINIYIKFDHPHTILFMPYCDSHLSTLPFERVYSKLTMMIIVWYVGFFRCFLLVISDAISI